MSAIPLTNAQRITALERLGYTEREAAFLCVAALHSGYFLRPQYWSFIGQESGSAAASLLEKSQAKKHAIAMPAFKQVKIYHLASRPFFNAIGEADNRNRREHSVPSIQNRLMGLDFVLAHKNYQYLATEREKVDYFSGVLGIPEQMLPFKHYISLKTSSRTTRYFVDKYPIFLNGANSTEPRSKATFCFVDDRSATLSGFETYLEQYAALWRHLHNFQVTYVADTPLLFEAADRCFELFRKEIDGSIDSAAGRLALRLIQYFETRSLYENREMESFTREKLIQFRNDRDEFSKPKHQALYDQWKASGPPAVLDQIAPKIEAPAACEVSFSTYLLKRRDGFFEGE